MTPSKEELGKELIRAASRGDLAQVKECFLLGADINCVDES